MSKYSGRLVSLGVARESTRGVGVAPSIWIPHTDLTVASKVKDVRVGPSLGKLADSEQRHVLTKFAEGEVGGEVRSHSFGYFLYALLGTLSTTGPTDTAAYTHAFTLDNSAQHDTLSLTIQDSDKTVIHELAALKSLEIEVPIDGVAKYTASFMARVAQGSSTKTVTLPTTERKFPKNDAAIKLAADIAGLGAASAMALKRFRITFSKELIDDDVIGSVWPEDFLAANFGVEGEFELNLENTTYRDYYLDNTYRSLQLYLGNSASLISGASTTYPSLTIQLPYVDFFGWEPNRPLDEVVSQTISFKANHDIANDQEIVHSCSLVNGYASYA